MQTLRTVHATIACHAVDLPVLDPEPGQGGHRHDLGLPHLTRCHARTVARIALEA